MSRPFALPLTVLLVLFALSTSWGQSTPDLGVTVRAVADYKRELGKDAPALARRMPDGNAGVIIMKVENGFSFAQAGFQQGDIILKIDAKTIKSEADFEEWVGSVQVGTKYSVFLSRPEDVKGKVAWKKQTINFTALPGEKPKVPDELNQIPALAKIHANAPRNDPQSLQAWQLWEASQKTLPLDKRPFEIKQDRLGMKLEMFKAKYFRPIPGNPDPAPFCSDLRPNLSNPALLYEANYAKAGIVCASTMYPFEYLQNRSAGPTIAGVYADTFVYSFIDGQLYEVFIGFKHDGYAQVREALIAKYGEPTKSGVSTLTTPLGAKYDSTEDRWSNDESTINLTERIHSIDQSILVFEHKSLAEKAKLRLKAVNPPRKDDL